MVDKNSDDPHIIAALLKRFLTIRLPKALALEKRVQAGESLTNVDLLFLESVFHDAQYIMKISDQHPEYREIVIKSIQLYSNMLQQALRNEKEKNNRNTPPKSR